MSKDNKTFNFIEKMKLQAAAQKKYGGEVEIKSASIHVDDCPNCGAGRAKQDGLTHCAYCKFEFMSVKLTDGLHIKHNDNSQ